MAVIINGTSGITNVNGSASTPAETGTDTDTGIYYGTNTVGLATNGTNALFIDASQNVGIGTSSPANKLHVFGTEVRIQQNAGYYSLFDTAGTRYGYIQGGSGYLDIVSEAGSANTIRFTTNSSERMRVDPSGNVGIGTSSPNAASKLEVSNGSAAANCKIRISNSGTYGAYIESATSNRTFQFGGVDSTNGFASGAYGVYDATAGTWRMVIDSSGNLLVGTTSQFFSGKQCIYFDGNSLAGLSLQTSKATTGSTYVYFVNSASAGTGSISQNGTTTVAYGTSSDYRLKENIKPMTGSLATVAQLKPVTYKWKADGSDGQGFIAHELQEVVPDCVIGEKDAVDADGNPVYQGIDTSFLVATLTAAIQEQQTLITALTARIEALEAK
jgi:hypothetical protein